jgi:DNA replication regulator DPB11
VHELEHGIMIVPDDLRLDDIPPTPQPAARLCKVTNWWVEKCLYLKKWVDPANDIMSKPFPAFPVQGQSKKLLLRQ